MPRMRLQAPGSYAILLAAHRASHARFVIGMTISRQQFVTVSGSQ